LELLSWRRIHVVHIILSGMVKAPLLGWRE